MKYVLVNDEDVVVWSSVAAELVAAKGVKETAALYGISEGKLRQFLNANGWVGKRQTSWEKVPETVAVEVSAGNPDGVAVDPETPQVPVPAGEEPDLF